ncbi:hypothetical protein AB0H60_25150 [Nocardia rhamnosiphila]|uniref:hypothetical protein n=1 Tax=Nocardia rhamnosiphila TaxID=426716 RepID=UPI00340785ED
MSAEPDAPTPRTGAPNNSYSARRAANYGCDCPTRSRPIPPATLTRQEQQTLQQLLQRAITAGRSGVDIGYETATDRPRAVLDTTGTE